MPELPEVETVVRGIRPFVTNQIIRSVSVRNPNLRYKIPDSLSESLVGSRIIATKRRAKYILLETDTDMTVVIHLGMSGTLTTHAEIKAEYAKHDHVIFTNDNGVVIYNDPRRFGLIVPVKKEDINHHRFFKNLGPEPLTNQFDQLYLKEALNKKKAPIKSALMDNAIVVGVGNIYACESLFRSGIDPQRAAFDLNDNEIESLTYAIREVLHEAIEAGGSTLKDYVNSSGKGGYFQHDFAVYGRAGESCRRCNATIQRIKQSGRSTFFCQSCQY
ncbi:MAG: bifunctional DNA-formamidopyrimidine glycosylase/DNA-(apurinic or apyrimidinic site) lyase [Rickettsiales bacterium]|nr:bifunctional DNA-formamidopyrimidine glycosylase/DNA-(apurinic or apyrimidinic site) lyase [Rickettsiales bacterium]